MIAGGNATVYVSNMDAAVGFYGQTLGLKVTNRFGERWATIGAGPSYWTMDEVGAGLVLGLHPPVAGRPAPGARGSVMFGLETYTPIDDVVAALSARGVRFSGSVVRFEAGNSIALEDPDGNPIYIHEFPPAMRDEADREATPAEPEPLLTGGHAIVYVANMDAAVQFYTKVLGLPLTNRYNDHWATVEAGADLVIGLHPASSHYPAPGTKGATILGLTVDEPIERVISQLSQRGVTVSGRRTEQAEIEIHDPDGNVIRILERNAQRIYGGSQAAMA
jgi:catechol 2,3-dioxygenase-like lactoylglutathione lyase family enzyme